MGNQPENQGRDSRLALFEGIIIGIYGNWLVSLIDKISFTSPLVLDGFVFVWFQPLLIMVSFFCLVALVALGIFGARLETRSEVVVLALGHFAPICTSFYVEGLVLQDAFFIAIGGILFSMIYVAEFERAKGAERARHKE